VNGQLPGDRPLICTRRTTAVDANVMSAYFAGSRTSETASGSGFLPAGSRRVSVEHLEAGCADGNLYRKGVASKARRSRGAALITWSSAKAEKRPDL
jgi:hypothetical protein